MTYPEKHVNETHDLLARITRDQSAKLARQAPKATRDMPTATRGKPAAVTSVKKTVPLARPVSEKKKQPNTTTIHNSDGTKSYRVQIRGRINGKQHSLCRTFTSPTIARAWRKQTNAQIELNGFPIPKANAATETIATILKSRLAKDMKIQRSAKQYLKYLSEHTTWLSKQCSELTVSDIVNFAEDMVSEGREPQTVAGYMSLLTTTLKRARRRGAQIPPQVIEDGMDILWDEGIIARSSKRERRPSIDELDRILHAVEANKRQKMPLEKIIIFAIFSTRRIGEICRLRWEDLNEVENTILVRDMKHPRKRKGNNVTVDLPKIAMQVIQSMPRQGEFIFPFNPRSLGTAFRRHRDALGIYDLHFHDLRHEGISCLFEMGETDYFVRKISGHEPGGCVARYAHVHNKGNKFENWYWIDRVINSVAK